LLRVKYENWVRLPKRFMFADGRVFYFGDDDECSIGDEAGTIVHAERKNRRIQVVRHVDGVEALLLLVFYNVTRQKGD